MQLLLTAEEEDVCFASAGHIHSAGVKVVVLQFDLAGSRPPVRVLALPGRRRTTSAASSTSRSVHKDFKRPRLRPPPGC